MSATAPRLSVVIPAFNEEARLVGTLARVLDYLHGRREPFEVIVVDDGSSDDTAGAARRAAAAAGGAVRVVANVRNRGKGFSVRRGVEESRGEFILFSDADLSTPIEDVERLFAALLEGGCDIAIGSRAMKGSDVRVHQPWYREAMGKTFNKLVRLLVLRGFRDTQCGFKLFRAPAARDIFRLQRVERFSFDVEALYLARRRGYRVAEVPVTWYNSPSSRVSIVRDSARMFLDVLRIRLNGLRGGYGPAAPAGRGMKR
jgi:dolichyl-phosphate beta-glucosyltransferase